MKFQRDNHSCGVLAILNAAKAIGVRLSEREIRKHSGTTADGTTQHGILNALERLGLKGTEIKQSKKDEAFADVGVAVSEGKAVILAVEEDQHWVAVIGACGKRLITFDSWNSKDNLAEAGIEVWDARTLRRWWTKVDGNFYGIIVERE
jgi:ABC-type bacteriocin/lantibiotic exporter with double-glycine peptidase domain